MNESLPKEQRAWWSINVTGYGRFVYYGTKAEADQMRRDKAEWEGGRGTMRDATEAEASKEREWVRKQKELGYGLDERELESIAETTHD